MELGYEKASMRSIANRCTLTAAGLYRHCRDKEDLFDQLVSPAVKRLGAWFEDHVNRYMRAAEADAKAQWQNSWVDMMREVVYPNMAEYHLLLAKSQGSNCHDFLHDMTEKSQKPFWNYLPYLRANGCSAAQIDEKHLHLLLSAYITALFELVIHNCTEEEALDSLDVVEAFFLPGWKKLTGF